MTAIAEADTISVGTSANNTLTLSDDTVSRYHLDVAVRRTGLLVVDLGSTNGTCIGNVRVERGYIEVGTQLQLGKTTIQVAVPQRGAIELHRDAALGELRGRTAVIRRLMARLRKVASAEVCVLLVGETGTGKELAAHALHLESARSEAPFVTVDCGALAPNLVASELFGHERGAFTGADRQRIGAFERAHGGTVFLDEIGELPNELQTQLLGVLSRRRFCRVGGDEEVAIDVRVVSATHRDLRADVNAGRFRPDLYFRLAVVKIAVPALRERCDDIPLLIAHFLSECGYGAAVDTLFPEASMQRLLQHAWPGNVRELRNVVEATLATGERPLLEPLASGLELPLLSVELSLPYKKARAKLVAEFESLYLSTLLERTEGNVSRAARVACMTRSHLFDLLRKHGLR